MIKNIQRISDEGIRSKEVGMFNFKEKKSSIHCCFSTVAANKFGTKLWKQPIFNILCKLKIETALT